jgi:hypothetical protein
VSEEDASCVSWKNKRFAVICFVTVVLTVLPEMIKFNDHPCRDFHIPSMERVRISIGGMSLETCMNKVQPMPAPFDLNESPFFFLQIQMALVKVDGVSSAYVDLRKREAVLLLSNSIGNSLSYERERARDDCLSSCFALARVA